MRMEQAVKTAIADAVYSTAVKLFCQECGINRDIYQVYFPGDIVCVKAPTLRLGVLLYQNKGRLIAQKCHEWARRRAEIWSCTPTPITVNASPTGSLKHNPTTGDSMTQALQTPELVFANVGIHRFNRALLDAMGRILESDRPMAMVRLRDQKQVFLNQKFSELLVTPPDIATGRNMKLGWNPAHLEECNRRIEQEGRFEFTYDSALNPQTYGRQTAVIELIDDGVDQYRLNTNQGLELLDWPDHMKQLQQFDW